MDAAFNYRHLFADRAGRLGEEMDLAEVALYIAAEDCPGVDVMGAAQTLDHLAHEASQYLEPAMDLATKLERLSLYLGVKQGFRGSRDDYYNPENAYLHRVLDRKRGIPITLCLVYMEVGLRLGILFEAIGLPGHLVIRAATPNFELYVDPFHTGRILSKQECVELIGSIYGGKVELQEEFFQPYTKKQFLTRLLSNLKNMYTKTGDYPRAIAAADRISLIDPVTGANLKERAWMFNQMGQYGKAIEDLEAYLRLNPKAEDAKRVKEQVLSLWKTIAALN